MKTIIVTFLLTFLLISCSDKNVITENTEIPINTSGSLEIDSGIENNDISISSKKTYTSKLGKIITVNEDVEGKKVTSPLLISGKVPTGWIFEGVLGAGLYTNTGGIIKQWHGTATVWDENGEVILPQVDFSARLDFDQEEFNGMDGYLELKNDNASGLPEFDDSIRIPVKF